MPRNNDNDNDNETLFPNWQKESWQTSEETSRYVRTERVNKWPNSMTHMMMMMMNRAHARCLETSSYKHSAD